MSRHAIASDCDTGRCHARCAPTVSTKGLQKWKEGRYSAFISSAGRFGQLSCFSAFITLQSFVRITRCLAASTRRFSAFRSWPSTTGSIVSHTSWTLCFPTDRRSSCFRFRMRRFDRPIRKRVACVILLLVSATSMSVKRCLNRREFWLRTYASMNIQTGVSFSSRTLMGFHWSYTRWGLGLATSSRSEPLGRSATIVALPFSLHCVWTTSICCSN